VVVLDAKEYERLAGRRMSVKDSLTQGPNFDTGWRIKL
jgi:hypothetical protein